ncbi:hypothetical protein N9N03_02235 [Chlamydiia bacterium]|nr:hypothetical protein [Chlamydiia bacterium]
MKKTFMLMLGVLVLVLTPVCWHHANNNENNEFNGDCLGCDQSSSTMTFIDKIFERLIAVDSTMLKAKSKWDIAKKQDDVIEICIALDNLIEGEKFQVLKQESIPLFDNAAQIILDSKFIESITIEYELVEEHWTNESGGKCGSITYVETSYYLDKLKNIYSENIEDIQKIIFRVMNMQNTLSDNEAFQAYMNLVTTEVGVFVDLMDMMDNSSDKSFTAMDVVHKSLETLCKLIESDEYVSLNQDPEANALGVELMDEILSHENLMTSLIDFLIEVETDLFDCLNELLTLDTNAFEKALGDIFWDFLRICSVKCSALNDVGDAVRESKTIKSIELLFDIINYDVDTNRYALENSHIDRLIENHEQLRENLTKSIYEKMEADRNHEIDEDNEL